MQRTDRVDKRIDDQRLSGINGSMGGSAEARALPQRRAAVLRPHERACTKGLRSLLILTTNVGT